ncbi:hypothetical protein T492DRAFT_1059598 [Pavlovales sp. CCMP2436]|nr:hypothetical protein T492DRAFT_1059598 [Pavlovales sp. CCMP2436]
MGTGCGGTVRSSSRSIEPTPTASSVAYRSRCHSSSSSGEAESAASAPSGEAASTYASALAGSAAELPLRSGMAGRVATLRGCGARPSDSAPSEPSYAPRCVYALAYRLSAPEVARPASVTRSSEAASRNCQRAAPAALPAATKAPPPPGCSHAHS